MKLKYILLIFIAAVSISAKAQIGVATQAFREMEKGNLSGAKIKIDHALKNDLAQKHKRAWYYKGRIYEELWKKNKNIEFAVESMHGYKMAMEFGMDPHTDVKVRFHEMGENARKEGVRRFKINDFEEAEMFFIAATYIARSEGRLDSLNFLNIAITNEKMQHYDKALSYLDSCMAIGFQPNNCAKFSLKILRAKGDENGVDSKIDEYRKMFPENLDLLNLDITNNLQKNRSKEAVGTVTHSINKYPENGGLLVVRGNLFYQLKQLKEAEKDYLKAVEVDPNYFEAYEAAGHFYAQSDIKKAIPYYEKAFELDPDKNNIGQTLLAAYKQNQEYNKYNLLKPKVK